MANHYLLITSQGAKVHIPCTHGTGFGAESLCQWGSRIRSWQVAHALPRDTQVILTWKTTTKSKEKTALHSCCGHRHSRTRKMQY